MISSHLKSPDRRLSELPDPFADGRMHVLVGRMRDVGSVVGLEREVLAPALGVELGTHLVGRRPEVVLHLRLGRDVEGGGH